MFILSGPYNSPFLGKSLRNLNECIFVANKECHMPFKDAYEIADKSTYDLYYSPSRKILTSLEDSLPFLYENFANNPSVIAAKRFKDKYDFRKEMGGNVELIYSPTILRGKDIKRVVKPISGISSKGVQILDANDEVFINTPTVEQYIVEDYIDGKEIAVDGFFDQSGAAIILNILEHKFANDKDVSDTLYWTNTKLVKEHLSIRNLLNDISRLYNLYDFPFHFEARLTKEGTYVPIELNPLRFAGYGTCEIAHYAHNINPYKAFFKNKIPKWTEKFEHMHLDEAYYGFYCAREVSSHDKLYNMFEEVLEYRIMPNDLETKVIVLFRERDKDKLQVFANTIGIV